MCFPYLIKKVETSLIYTWKSPCLVWMVSFVCQQSLIIDKIDKKWSGLELSPSKRFDICGLDPQRRCVHWRVNVASLVDRTCRRIQHLCRSGWNQFTASLECFIEKDVHVNAVKIVPRQTHMLCHAKTTLKRSVIVIPKEGWAVQPCQPWSSPSLITSHVSGRGNLFGSIRLCVPVHLFALCRPNHWTYSFARNACAQFGEWGIVA